MNADSPQKPTTLRNYIAFLREHGFNKEADYYENDVVSVLKQAGVSNPAMLSTREVVATLYGIIDAAATSSIINSRPWEVELVS